MVWTNTKNYEAISKSIFDDYVDNSQTPIWRKFIWKRFIPPRFSIHRWKALYGRISTNNNLRKCGIQVVSRYRLCEVHAETFYHLLVHCCISKRLLEFIEECFWRPLNFASDFGNLFSSALKEREVLSQQVFEL